MEGAPGCKCVSWSLRRPGISSSFEARRPVLAVEKRLLPASLILKRRALSVALYSSLSNNIGSQVPSRPQGSINRSTIQRLCISQSTHLIALNSRENIECHAFKLYDLTGALSAGPSADEYVSTILTSSICDTSTLGATTVHTSRAPADRGVHVHAGRERARAQSHTDQTRRVHAPGVTGLSRDLLATVS